MSDFAGYYQDELAYLRELGREFAQAHPALAPMLAERSGDPDVERLLEGVAFLTGRVRQKLDDELPHAIQGIAQLLFPDLVRPMPSAAILEMTPLPTVLRERLVVPAGTEFASVKVDGTSCVFRSTADCELMPWVIDDVRVAPLPDGKHELRIDLKMPLPMPIAPLGADRVRLHFAGDGRTSLGTLMWIHQSAESVSLFVPSASGEREVVLGRGAIESIGFDESEALLPAPPTAFAGPRLIEEYCVLPAKFAFADVVGVSRVREVAPTATRFSIAIRFASGPPAELRLGRESIKLHCVPVVNVFATTAEPLALSLAKNEYLVRPSGLSPSHGEVYAVTHVEALGEGGARSEIYSFYDFPTSAASRGGRSTPHTCVRAWWARASIPCSRSARRGTRTSSRTPTRSRSTSSRRTEPLRADSAHRRSVSLLLRRPRSPPSGTSLRRRPTCRHRSDVISSGASWLMRR